jgi:hypothetical protein
VILKTKTIPIIHRTFSVIPIVVDLIISVIDITIAIPHNIIPAKTAGRRNMPKLS